MIVSCKSFDELTVHELYEIMALRQEVFVIEQNCAYQDADGKDQPSHHLQCRDAAGKLVAYTRLLPIGVAYPTYASIGRVVSSPSVRGTGIGKALISESLAAMKRLFGDAPIKIGAQTYLLQFYENQGFISTGEAYLEDGIPHTKMVWKTI